MNKYQKALSLVIEVVEMDNGCAGIFFKDNGEIFEAIDVLKELIEKTIPKKPAFNKLFENEETASIYDEYGFINPVICVCPHCRGSGIYDFEYDVKFKHCTDCGGAIDWSDE